MASTSAHSVLKTINNTLSRTVLKVTCINEFYMIDETYSSIARKVTEMEPAVAVARKSGLFKYLTGSQTDLTDRFSEPLAGSYFNVVVLGILPQLNEAGEPAEMMNQAQAAVRIIDQFVASLYGADYHHALYMLQQLLTELNKQYNLMGSAVGEQRELFARMAFHAVSYETLEAFAADLAALCRCICEQMEAKTKNRNTDQMSTIKAYIAKIIGSWTFPSTFWPIMSV
ncbi:hypothetical protein B0G52_101366 [Cohnella sp. SGD-V74]|nr:hypothetical protein B0G52_101366 [Cohnella sp. SGD-V74]